MNLEAILISDLAPLDLPTYWIQADLTDPETELPLMVLNYLSDIERRYVDGRRQGYEGRITFTLNAKSDSDLMRLKNEVRRHLFSLENWNFNENTALTAYEDALKLYVYQLDMNFVYSD